MTSLQSRCVQSEMSLATPLIPSYLQEVIYPDQGKLDKYGHRLTNISDLLNVFVVECLTRSAIFHPLSHHRRYIIFYCRGNLLNTLFQIERLRHQLSAVQENKAFLLHAGDCAESFDACTHVRRTASLAASMLNYIPHRRISPTRLV